MGPAPPDMPFFDVREQELVARALETLDGADAVALAGRIVWLGRLAHVVVECPLREGRDVDDRVEYDFATHAPTHAVLGQAYLVAKIDLFRDLEALLPDGELRARAHFELGQSVYSRLAEDLFIAILCDRSTPDVVKDRARALLRRIWDQRLLDEIDDFAPVLEAAWEARNKVKPLLGTMLGTHELFRLFQQVRDERFLEYFSADDLEPEQTEAFEEFLFGLAHEEIARLRTHLAEHRLAVIAPGEAAALIGRDPTAGGDSPDALYASYRRRKLEASYRALTGAAGPKHTAEEYVMLAFLEHG